MVFSSTFRSVFGGHGALKHAQSHSHSAVADPNSVIAAKKSILARLFSCPVKDAKNTAAAQQQQQQQSLTASGSCNADAALVPFHTHAGTTARASLRPRFAHQHNHAASSASASSSSSSSIVPRRAIRYRLRHCNCPALLAESIRRHTVGCRASQQHAEEEADESTHHAKEHWFALQFRAGHMWPSILIQESKAGQQPNGANQLVVTASSPVYQQLFHSLATLSHLNPFASVPSLIPSAVSSTVASTASPAVARDLPDEKNNDHIPLPTLAQAIHTVHEAGDCYTGQLCPLTAQQHGRGAMQYANGESYDGEWENGQQHGQGVMCYRDGRYSGQYVRGERCGMGVWESEDGNKYEGEWKGGLRNGKGKEWQGDELVYDGDWAANARHGYGVAQSAAGGWRYEGEWVSGVMDGYGSIEYSTGEVWEGQWHAGAMHGEGMRISSTGSSQLETLDQGSLVLSQLPATVRQSSEGMGALDALDECSTNAGVEGVSNGRSELLSLLSQVASLQSALVNKLSRVEELLVQPPAGKQSMTMPALMGAVSMAA